MRLLPFKKIANIIYHLPILLVRHFLTFFFISILFSFIFSSILVWFLFYKEKNVPISKPILFDKEALNLIYEKFEKRKQTIEKTVETELPNPFQPKF